MENAVRDYVGLTSWLAWFVGRRLPGLAHGATARAWRCAGLRVLQSCCSVMASIEREWVESFENG